MKKMACSTRDWLNRKQVRKHRNALYAAQIKKVPQRIKRDMLIAPAYFCLISKENVRGVAPENFLQFIRTIRTYSGSRLCIDMSGVNRLIVNATLLFKAEISHLIQRGVQITAITPKKQRSQQVLTQTGLSRLLGLQECTQIDREDTVHWRHASGAWNLAQPARLAALLDPGVNPHASTLYTGMIESVSNCIEHAYQVHPERRHFKESQDGWWGFQQVRDGVLSTCICDLGIGISRALPISLSTEPDLFRALLSLVRHHKGEDVKSILAAIEYGRSSTGQLQRGKGLRDAHRVIDDAGEGHLHVFSNRGFYFYLREKGKPNATSGTRRLQGSIAGTIYYWQYPIQSDDEAVASSVQGVIL